MYSAHIIELLEYDVSKRWQKKRKKHHEEDVIKYVQKQNGRGKLSVMEFESFSDILKEIKLIRRILVYVSK